MARQVAVHTYNILSSKLCTPDYFIRVNPRFIEPTYRFQQITKKLKEQSISKNAIICLQEIPREWAGPLYTFFCNENYVFIKSLYGTAFNGYMGVGLAFPRIFKLEDCTITRVSDSKRWPDPPQIQLSWIGRITFPFVSAVRVFSELWSKYVRRALPETNTPVEAYSYAKGRNNTLIFTKFSFQDQAQNKNQFCVATYHMPCVYWSPETMMIHTALSARLVQDLAGNLPTIYAGDFNFQPDSSCYDFITSGKLNESNPDYPRREYDPWKPELLYAFSSAYAQALGTEPKYTNFAHNKNSLFKGTLDYLFMSPGITAQNVVDIPQNTGPVPSKLEPSDHFLVGADFLLPE
jgi:2',5'-phosphodiesterase